MKRGRKSAAEIAIAARPVALVDRPTPPLDLTEPQSDVWTGIVEALPADWFPPETFPLLAQYCRHTVEARRIAQLIDQECARRDLDVGAYSELLKMQDRESRALKALAASMRIAQQSSRTDGSSATAKKNRGTVNRPWE